MDIHGYSWMDSYVICLHWFCDAHLLFHWQADHIGVLEPDLSAMPEACCDLCIFLLFCFVCVFWANLCEFAYGAQWSFTAWHFCLKNVCFWFFLMQYVCRYSIYIYIYTYMLLLPNTVHVFWGKSLFVGVCVCVCAHFDICIATVGTLAIPKLFDPVVCYDMFNVVMILFGSFLIHHALCQEGNDWPLGVPPAVPASCFFLDHVFSFDLAFAIHYHQRLGSIF